MKAKHFWTTALAGLLIGCSHIQSEPRIEMARFDYNSPSDVLARAWEHISAGKTKFQRQDLRLQNITYPFGEQAAYASFLVMTHATTNRPGSYTFPTLTIKVDREGRVVDALAGRSSGYDSKRMEIRPQ